MNGRTYTPGDSVPTVVKSVAEQIEAPFYSVDVIQNREGAMRVVELGDRRVSDKKDWPLDKFVDVIAAIAQMS